MPLTTCAPHIALDDPLFHGKAVLHISFQTEGIEEVGECPSHSGAHGAVDIERLETPAMIFYKRLPKKEIIDQSFFDMLERGV